MKQLVNSMATEPEGKVTSMFFLRSKLLKVVAAGIIFVILYFTTSRTLYYEDERLSYVKNMTKLPDRANLSNDVTIITAYLNIGEFPKGSQAPKDRRSPSNYSNWMMSFHCIRNPVVAFFDIGDPLVGRFRRIRRDLAAMTEVRDIRRNQLWTFKILANVSRIFSKPHYPVHFPNTAVPEYACVSSSRFELVKRVIEENPFATRYFAWIDIGYFRRRLNTSITLTFPDDLDENTVAFAQVMPRNSALKPEQIIRKNINWLAAGYFTGHYKAMYQFASGYLTNLQYFLDRGWMAAEQQMIYSMVNTDITRNRLPPIKTYNRASHKLSCQEWFYLGCVCTQKVS